MVENSPSPMRPLETIRRVAESIIIAVVSSAALYLVGWVHVDGYYGRLALEVIPPDLPPRTWRCRPSMRCGACWTTHSPC